MQIDPGGFRFPYWWNFVDWPEVPREHLFINPRFGSSYDLDTLLSPLDLSASVPGRLDKAILLSRHMDFPRSSIVESIREVVPVEIARNVANGRKQALLRNYRFAVVAENSPGYGYETEKVPEAWVSGCIPVGFVRPPFSDFSEGSTYFTDLMNLPSHLPPLLAERPTLTSLFSYLSWAMERADLQGLWN